MKTREYLIVRYGSNAANQHRCNRLPVALVVASSRAEAAAVETQAHPTIYDCAWLALNPAVSLWANQRVQAIPLSRARISDLRALGVVVD